MYGTNRNALREVILSAWQKFQQAEPLQPVESMLVNIIASHPEFHFIFNQPEKYLEQEYFPEIGDINPFYHISLHLALEEQLNLDRPAGIQAVFSQLVLKHSDRSYAEHLVMEHLASFIQEMVKSKTLPCEKQYLRQIRNLLE